MEQTLVRNRRIWTVRTVVWEGAGAIPPPTRWICEGALPHHPLSGLIKEVANGFCGGRDGELQALSFSKFDLSPLLSGQKKSNLLIDLYFCECGHHLKNFCGWGMDHKYGK